MLTLNLNMIKAKIYRNIFKSSTCYSHSRLSLTARAIYRNKLQLDLNTRSFTYFYYYKGFGGFPSFYKANCFVTGRSRGVISPFIISRLTFKNYAMAGSLTGFFVSRWLFFIILLLCQKVILFLLLDLMTQSSAGFVLLRFPILLLAVSLLNFFIHRVSFLMLCLLIVQRPLRALLFTLTTQQFLLLLNLFRRIIKRELFLTSK
jgi:ribosomal protein S14